MKKSIQKYTLGKEPTEFQYWKNKTFTERIEALEIIRKMGITISYPDAPKTFQRVIRVSKQA